MIANQHRGENFMKYPIQVKNAVLLAILSQPAWGEEVQLPAPVLEWSFYVLLIFGVCVAIGILFFRSGSNRKEEMLGGLLDQSECSVHSVGPDTSVRDCVRQMNEHNIGAMLVTRDSELLGIFSERDAITKVLGGGLEPDQTQVSEVMSTHPICVTPLTTLEEAMAIVTHQRIRHLPMVEDGKILGMVSSGDLTHWLVREQSSDVQELVDIAGRRRASH
jgi:CBS domain-containing protein